MFTGWCFKCSSRPEICSRTPTEEGSGSERKILLRSTRKAVLVIVLFAAVISIVQLAQRDKRWKHLDTLLRTGELEEAVAWMDMHPGDIPEQTEYKNHVLACMDYERPWVFCGGNIMLISSEGETHERKPLPVFMNIPHNIDHLHRSN